MLNSVDDLVVGCCFIFQSALAEKHDNKTASQREVAVGEQADEEKAASERSAERRASLRSVEKIDEGKAPLRSQRLKALSRAGQP